MPKPPPGVAGYPLGNQDNSKRGRGLSGGNGKKRRGCLPVLLLVAGAGLAATALGYMLTTWLLTI